MYSVVSTVVTKRELSEKAKLKLKLLLHNLTLHKQLKMDEWMDVNILSCVENPIQKIFIFSYPFLILSAKKPVLQESY